MKKNTFLLGVTVGIVFSLDNSAGTAAITSMYGTNLWILVGEILSHIGVIVIAWFIGSKVEGESRLFAVLSTACMWGLAVWELIGG